MSNLKKEFERITSLQDNFYSNVKANGERFYNFILKNDTRNIINHNITPNRYSTLQDIAQMNMFSSFHIAFEIPECLDSRNIDINDGIVFYIFREDEDVWYFMVPYEYMEDPQTWEDSFMHYIEDIDKLAFEALYRVFPKLPKMPITITTSFANGCFLEAKDIQNIVNFTFDFKSTASSSLFAYEGVIYSNKQGLCYKVDTDEIYVWDYKDDISIIAQGKALPLIQPLTPANIKTYNQKRKGMIENARTNA